MRFARWCETVAWLPRRQACGLEFDYRSRPNWETYRGLLAVVEEIRRDLRDLRPRDMIELQSFMWVQGSDEYD